jgi:hypothetical protein
MIELPDANQSGPDPVRSLPPPSRPSNVADLGSQVADLKAEIEKLKEGRPITSTTSDVAVLTNQVTTLKEEVEKLKKNKLAKIGAAFAATATVLSLLNGYFSLHDTLLKKPNTAVVNGSSLVMAYSPTSRMLKITFGFSLQNLGNADDSVSSINGRLTDQNTGSFAPLSDFNCIIGNSVQRMPFTVPKEANTTATCTVSSVLGTLSSEPFASPGTKQFAMNMVRGSGPELNWSVCFDLDANTVDQIAKRKGALRRQFFYQPCSKEVS